MTSALIFAVVWAVLVAAHNLADHVTGQSDHQAAHKAERSRRGLVALLGHVFQYHLTMLIMLLITLALLNVPVSLIGLIAGLLFSAVTHAFFDLRWPVRWILEHIGSPNFANLQTPVNGMYQADQALHYAALWVSALLIACL